MERNAAAPSSNVQLVPAEQVTGRRKAKHNVNDKHKDSLNPMERLALWITDNIGTMGFFLLIFFWTVIWMTWNYMAARFGWSGVLDKPFEFGVWLFISNLIQILLMPLIMVGQNLQSRHAEMRAEQEFQLTAQTEHEMAAALHYLEQIHADVRALGQRMDKLDGAPRP